MIMDELTLQWSTLGNNLETVMTSEPILSLVRNSPRVRYVYSLMRANDYRASCDQNSKKNVFEIPIVFNGLGTVIQVGNPANWEEGVAERVMHKEYSVCVATFCRASAPRNSLPPRMQEQPRPPRSSQQQQLIPSQEQQQLTPRHDENKPCNSIRYKYHPYLKTSVQQAEAQGPRSRMEDTYIIHMFRKLLLFGVFDGHGGIFVSELIRDNILQALRAEFVTTKHDIAAKKLAENLRGAIQSVEELVLRTIAGTSDFITGSTLCIGICTIDALIVAHVGDSRLVLAKCAAEPGASPPPPLLLTTKDHRASDPEECENVIRLGGIVDEEGYLCEMENGMCLPALQVSRALGDLDHTGTLKFPGLSAEPDVTITKLDSRCEFAIMACDGLWEKITEIQAVDLVRQKLGEPNGSCKSAAEALIVLALKRSCTDNVTVLVVAFKDDLYFKTKYKVEEKTRPFIRKSLQQLMLQSSQEEAKEGEAAAAAAVGARGSGFDDASSLSG